MTRSVHRPAYTTWLLSAALLLAARGGQADDNRPQPQPDRQVLYRSGEGGYHTYRIPALAVSDQGTLLAFCEGRRNSPRDHGDIDLLLRRSSDGGRTWSEQVVIHGEPGNVTIGNPCPVVDRRTGTIWLALCRDNDRVLMTHSDDDGLTWAEPADITADVKRDDWDWYATGPGQGLQLAGGKYAGRLVFPCDHRVQGHEGGWRGSGRSHVFYSDDGGKTFQLGEATPGWGMNECEAVELADGRLLLSMRNYHGKDRRAFSLSDDGGQSWSEPEHHEQVYCPTCQSSIRRFSLEPQNVILYSGPGGPGRNNLTIRATLDEGRQWRLAKVLQPGPSGYSDLAVLPDGTIGCLYETGEKDYRHTITFARFRLNWLHQQ